MTNRKLRQRQLILGGDPDMRFQVPVEADFDRQGTDWIEAQGCEKIAQKLIAERSCFQQLKGAAITFLWKKKASSKPKFILGKCQRPSGLLKYFAHSDFVIWFAANNCLTLGLTHWQMEALVFHELKHADYDEGAPVSVPHDWEGFVDEIKYYGFWKRDIQAVADIVEKNLQLPFDTPPAKDGGQAYQFPPRAEAGIDSR